MSKVKKERGRPRVLSPEDAIDIRNIYFTGRTPRGRRYTAADVARLYKVSVKTILNVIDRKAPYNE